MVKGIKTTGVKVLASLLCLSGVLFANNVCAAEDVNCKVLTIEATNDGSGVAQPLREYASVFSQKPFDTFNSFRLVSEKEYTLPLNKPLTLSLPDQLNGTLAFKGKSNNNLQLTLKLAKAQNPPIIIDGKAGNGIPFMAAGFKSPNGRWILAVKCND
jgi:DNA-binding NtrC family response regulator